MIWNKLVKDIRSFTLNCGKFRNSLQFWSSFPRGLQVEVGILLNHL